MVVALAKGIGWASSIRAGLRTQPSRQSPPSSASAEAVLQATTTALTPRRSRNSRLTCVYRRTVAADFVP